MAMFSSYQEGCTCNFSLPSLPFGLHACQMFVRLPQFRSAMLVCRLAPAVTSERGGHCPVALFMYTQIPSCSYPLKTSPSLQLWRGHTARTQGHQDTRVIMVPSQRPFRLTIWKTSLSPVYLALWLTWDVIFHVRLGWNQGCHPVAPNDRKSTPSLGVQLSLHCVTLLHRNVLRISSVGFADFQTAAHAVAHASGC